MPGWGYQLDLETVLTQMRDVGISATEFGPDGFLPDAPEAKAATLARHGLQAVGQFVSVVLHDAGFDPLPTVEEAMAGLVAAHASTVVIAAATGADGYDERSVLDDAQWSTLLVNLDRTRDAAAARGLVGTLNPHVGTMVESGEEIDRVLAGSSIGLCLDTGHLLIGGGDPVKVAVEHPDRIAHVHLKDVGLELAHKVQSGELTYTGAVGQSMYVPLGEGDVDVAAIVTALENNGYAGWYVLEQDTVLAGPPQLTGTDPIADVRASIAHILSVAARTSGDGASGGSEG